ncbi:hypothetical protein KQX54_000692 [Cotesia glomerata]|uniref:Uncharacterized protein n=1 Tax=Cotesia glomerata TaxID=32391 RepID=A0AAV7HR95_COTGL|nr:hypothetical protein KQX54_000692 [Cotesia glomerata]
MILKEQNRLRASLWEESCRCSSGRWMNQEFCMRDRSFSFMFYQTLDVDVDSLRVQKTQKIPVRVNGTNCTCVLKRKPEKENRYDIVNL